MCLKKSKLIYILIPLFLVITISCEQKPKEEPLPLKQEVVTMKISTPPPVSKIDNQNVSAIDNQNVSAINNQNVSLNNQNVSELNLNNQNIAASEKNADSEPIPSVDLNLKEEKEGVISIDKTSENNIVLNDNKSNNNEIDQSNDKNAAGQDKNTTVPIKQKTESTAQTAQEEQIEDKNLVDQKTILSNTEIPDTKNILPGMPDKTSDSDDKSNTSEDSINIEDFNKQKLIIPDENVIKTPVEKEKLFYIVKGKIDPFEPLIKEKAPVEEVKKTLEENVPERILTPLEKLDFSQMKLVAILNKESGSVAMVQESTGKGYIVNIGTYMGRDSGQVVSIEKDKIVIQEKTKDYKGNVVNRFQELKLNKLNE